MSDFQSVPAIQILHDRQRSQCVSESLPKAYLVGMLRAAQYEVVDFGDEQQRPDDDYPDFVMPLARAVARGQVAWVRALRPTKCRARGRA